MKTQKDILEYESKVKQKRNKKCRDPEKKWRNINQNKHYWMRRKKDKNSSKQVKSNKKENKKDCDPEKKWEKMTND